MSDINNVVIGGRLTRDAEVKETKSGNSVGNFTIASNRRRKVDGNNQEETVFLDVVVWGKRAEGLCPYLTKGTHIVCIGRLNEDQWENKEGQKRSKITMILDDLHFSQNGKREDSEQSEQPEEKRVDFEAEETVVASQGEDVPF